MPFYTFESSDGDRIEKFYSMSMSPTLGQWIKHQGKRYRRIADGTQISAGVARITHQYPYVSHQLPRNLKGCGTDKTGKPIIRSRGHENEVMARHGYERE